MTAPRPYALEEMLPFARAALQNYERLRSDFSSEDFAEGLFFELEKIRVEGVVRGGFPASTRTKFNYGGPRFPDGLRRAVSEVLWYLIHHGFILPQWRDFPSVTLTRSHQNSTQSSGSMLLKDWARSTANNIFPPPSCSVRRLRKKFTC
jgi:hypothetical protein